jgi:hypothetical protein
MFIVTDHFSAGGFYLNSQLLCFLKGKLASLQSAQYFLFIFTRATSHRIISSVLFSIDVKH